MATFIVDCARCKAKVAAEQHGCVTYRDFELGFGMESKVLLGKCPSCSMAVVGRADEIGFMGDEDGEHVVFSDVVRVYPDPPRAFTSSRIPRALNQSLSEADRCFQAGANIAASVMLGRALEALCRDLLKEEAVGSKEVNPAEASAAKPQKRVMLGRGIRELRDRKFIDERLYDWSMSLHAMRNLAAHPEDINVSRQDVEDLRAFVYAITEYVYDLTDRYNEFKEREAESKKPRPTAAEMFSGVLSKLPLQGSSSGPIHHQGENSGETS